MILESPVCEPYVYRALRRLRGNGSGLVVELGMADDGSSDLLAQRDVRLVRADPGNFNEQSARRLREEHGRADLIAANVTDFVDRETVVEGLRLLLAWNGTLLLAMSDLGGLNETSSLLERHALRIYDIEQGVGSAVEAEAWGCHGADVRRVSKTLRDFMR